MRKMNSILKPGYLVLSFLLVLSSCKTERPAESEETDQANSVISDVRQDHAPDQRVGLFNIESEKRGEKYILKGESNLPDAVADLREKLDNSDIAYTDSIQMLPADHLEGNTQGVIKISVANLRSRPAHSSELVTQATLGTPVKVYKKDGGWYYIQTPDGYLAWVDYGGVTPISDEAYSTWKASDKVIYLEPFGFAYEQPLGDAPVVSDLVAGNILELLGERNGFYEVRYPDDKKGFIEVNKAQPYRDWVASLNPTGETLIETSKSLLGLPYLWGGTSPKGVDCSGYTKTIFFLNGIILPRDASQQIHTGMEVDSTRDFENLEPGDLLFFGRKATETSAERVIHVGMWIGDDKFIHSMGDVHISTFDSEDPEFDQYNYDRYLRTKRILDQEDEKLIQLAHSDLFME